jgi:alpha/beta superfamily hydrolase
MSSFLPGPRGRLEARLWEPEGLPRATCVFCHPHPLRGGTMQTTVVFRAARALQEAGACVLRFNFRGVGLSEGEHDGQGGEEDDLAAALDWLEGRYPGLPRWAGGFSFGARTAAGLAARVQRLDRLVLVALPVAAFDCGVIRDVRTPGLVVQGGADDFGTLADLRRLHPELYPGLELGEVPGAGHFFQGQIEALQERLRSAAERWLSPSPDRSRP